MNESWRRLSTGHAAICSAILAIASATATEAQERSDSNALPKPSGSFSIGRTTYHWIDSSRAETLIAGAPQRREVLVDVWYPAVAGTAAPATYLAHLSILRQTVGEDSMRRRFAPAYPAIERGRLFTHATRRSAGTLPRPWLPRASVLAWSWHRSRLLHRAI